MPEGRSQTGTRSPCARNIPTSFEPSAIDVLAGGVQPGERVEQRRLVLRAAPSAGAPWSPRRPSTPPRPRRAGPWARPRRSPAPAPRPSPASRSVDVAEPPLEAVVHGDLERLVGHQVLQPGAGPGGSIEPDDARLVGRQRLLQHGGRGRGTGRRTSAAPAGPATPRRCRAPSPAPPSAAASRAVTVRSPDRQRGGRRRHELAQRHQVALGRPAPRTAGPRRRRRPSRGTPCSACPSRTGRARAGPTSPVGGARSRALVRDFLAMPARLEAGTPDRRQAVGAPLEPARAPARGRSVITALDPERAAQVQLLLRCSRSTRGARGRCDQLRGELRVLASARRCPGPRIQPSSTTGLSIGQCRAFSISITSRRPGASRCIRCSAT